MTADGVAVPAGASDIGMHTVQQPRVARSGDIPERWGAERRGRSGTAKM